MSRWHRTPGRWYPTDDPFYLPPAGFEHAAARHRAALRDVELAFLGLIPQRVTATQLLYRTTDMSRRTRGGRHHRDRARRTRPRTARARWSPTSAPSTRSARAASPRMRCAAAHTRLGALAQFEFLLVAAADRRGLGGVGARPRGHARHLGRPLRAGLPRARRYPRGAGLRARWACPRRRRSASGATRAAGWPARGPPRCAAPTPPNSTSSARCSARPSATSATPSAGSTAPSTRACPPLVVAALADIYPGPRQGHPGARHRGGQDAAGSGCTG